VSSVASVHVLEASLVGWRPPVRRVVEVPSLMTLGQLHLVLQAAFQWGDDHLHDFRVRGQRYTPDWPDVFEPLGLGDGPRDEDLAVLGLLAPRPGDVIDYTYDFGDCWRHRIEVISVDVARPDGRYPTCVGGSGAGPEEHTGRVRPGQFGDAARERVNARLGRLGVVPGSELPAGDVTVDRHFSGLYPDLVVELAGPCPCGCGEMLDGGGHPPVPARRPVPDSELAEAAGASLLVRRALALAGWVGSGRALTPSRVLRPADAVAAQEELGLAGGLLPRSGGVDAEPAAAGGGGSGRRIRSAKDLPSLHPLWMACLAAGLIEVRGSKAHPGPGLAVWHEPAEPAAQVESWCALVSGWLRARADATSGARDVTSRLAGQIGQLAPPVLYGLAQEPVPLAVLALTLAEQAEQRDDHLYGWWSVHQLGALAARVRQLADDWLVAGGLELAELAADQVAALADELAEIEGPVQAALAEAGSHVDLVEEVVAPLRELIGELRAGVAVQLTALGCYGLARLLTAHGWTIPLPGACTGAEPEELLDRLADHLPPDDGHSHR
jgi:hypothetical protein